MGYLFLYYLVGSKEGSSRVTKCRISLYLLPIYLLPGLEKPLMTPP